PWLLLLELVCQLIASRRVVLVQRGDFAEVANGSFARNDDEAHLPSSTEMWRHLLAHQLQRTHDFVDGKSAAAIDLGKDAAKPDRPSQLSKPLRYGVRRPDNDLLTQDIRV